MSVLSKAIRACLGPVMTGDSGDLQAEAVFPSGFPGFDGHFPGKPVLPGVCLVQTAIAMLGVHRKAPVGLKRLITAKWPAPVLPGETIRLVLKPAGESIVKVSVTRGADKVAEFSLEIVTEVGSAL